MSIASRITSIENHIEEAYTEISRLGVDLTNVDKNIDNIADKLQEAYSQAPKVTGEGSSLSLTPTRKGGLSIIPKGACEQDSYSGKNLCPQNNLNITNVNVTIPVNLDIGTYTFSIQDYQTNGSGQSLVQALYEGETSYTYLIGLSATNKVVTTTLSKKLTNIRVFADLNYSSSQGKTTTITSLMIESGSTATEYEQYVGGIPAPNPDFPQSVRVVTGDNSFLVQNKNLFNSTIEIGSFNNQSGAPSPSGFAIRTTNFILVKPNTKYTISNDKEYHIFTYYYDKNKNFISYVNGNEQSIISNYTFTTPENCYWVKFRTAANTNENDITCKWQLEYGENVTPYIAHAEQSITLHLGTEYLAGIGTYKDQIVGKTDDWKIVRNVGKYTFDNSTTIYYGNTNTTEIKRMVIQVTDDIVKPSASNVGLIKCTHYTPISANQTYQKNVGISASATTNQFQFYDNTYNTSTSGNSFKSWAITNNLIIYYALSTPTEETITNQTLITDLNNMYQAVGYDGTTNISITSDTSNAQMIASVSALKGE